jgi:hypothetical protein
LDAPLAKKEYGKMNYDDVVDGLKTKLSPPRLARFAEAYVRMAEVGDYRPQAPGDGVGGVYLTPEQCADPALLAKEAVAYARRLSAEEDTGSYRIGCTNFSSNRAFVWTIEAARSLCGAADDVAIELLTMALAEVRAEGRNPSVADADA